MGEVTLVNHGRLTGGGEVQWIKTELRSQAASVPISALPFAIMSLSFSVPLFPHM